MVHDSILAEWCRSAEHAVKHGPIADFHRAGQVRENDPSPEEIASMTAEIRSGWSDEERTKRAAWAAPRSPELPMATDGEYRERWALLPEC